MIPHAKFYVNLTKGGFPTNRPVKYMQKKFVAICIPFFFNAPTDQTS